MFIDAEPFKSGGKSREFLANKKASKSKRHKEKMIGAYRKSRFSQYGRGRGANSVDNCLNAEKLGLLSC